MLQQKTYRRFVSFVAVIILLLALPLGTVCASNKNDHLTDDVPQNVQRSDDAALLCLALVGGVAVLAASVLMSEFRRKLL